MPKFYYKCCCNPWEQTVLVRERRDDEAITDFMKNVIEPALAKHHRALSPLCSASKSEYVKIHVSKDNIIGQE